VVAGTGFVGDGVGHSDFTWLCRQFPPVRKAFAAIWDSKPEEMLTSMDVANVFVPWHRPGLEKFKTNGGWFHVD